MYLKIIWSSSYGLFASARSPVARSLDRSIARSHDRLVARSLVAQSLGRSIARSLDRSITCSIGRISDRSIAWSPNVRSPDRAIARPLDRPIARSLDRSLVGSIARPIARLLSRPVACSVDRLAKWDFESRADPLEKIQLKSNARLVDLMTWPYGPLRTVRMHASTNIVSSWFSWATGTRTEGTCALGREQCT